jgi:hypothetical protein
MGLYYLDDLVAGANEQAFRRPCRTNRRSAQAVLSLAG